jgi:ribosome-binding factor A
MADKFGRVQQIIKKDLTNIIIYQMKAKICDFASITDVKLTSDYSYCTVYVSHVESDKIDDLAAFLNNNKGYIRSLLAKSISIYKTPELKFVPDKLYDQAHQMDVMIDEAVNRKPTTLKDVYGKNYKTPEQKEALKKKREEKKALEKKASKKSATKKTTTRKTTTTKSKKKTVAE